MNFNTIYKNGLKGWEIYFRKSQLYRFEKYIKLLRKNNMQNKVQGKILDIACGDGIFTACYLARIFDRNNILGVDISDLAITYVKETYKKNNNLSFMIDKLPNLEKVDNVYDFILINECLYYLSIEEQLNSIKKIYDIW